MSEASEPYSSSTKPAQWGQCDTVRKCPWVSCRYHLGTTPNAELLDYTCALQVAAQRPHSLREIAEIFGVRSSSIDKSYHAAIKKLKAALSTQIQEMQAT